MKNYQLKLNKFKALKCVKGIRSKSKRNEIWMISGSEENH